PALYTGLPCPHEVSGDNADDRNASLLNSNHVMGKPRRASPSMGGGADNGIHLLGNPGRLLGIDMGPTAERQTAWPEVAPVALELDVGITPAEVLGRPLHSNICPTRHVVVQADGLAFQAAQARSRGDLKIPSVCNGGHDLHLHAVSPLGCNTAAVRGPTGVL